MNQVELYHSNNLVQVRDATETLEKFKTELKWDGIKKAMDIGCGPGNVTYHCLFPFTSNNTELLGIDIHEPMVRFANSHYSDNSRLKFETLDVMDLKIVEKYASNFDAVFSFYCFHWIHDQRRLIEHIYSILKPGGKTLFAQIFKGVCYPLFEILAQTPKWSPYTKDFKNMLPPYHNSSDPVSEIGEFLRNAGFVTKECYLESKSFTFPSREIFFDWMDGINPFSKNIPEDLAEEYERAWKKIIMDDNNLYKYNKTTNEITVTYSLLIVFAQKPLTSDLKLKN